MEKGRNREKEGGGARNREKGERDRNREERIRKRIGREGGRGVRLEEKYRSMGISREDDAYCPFSLETAPIPPPPSLPPSKGRGG